MSEHHGRLRRWRTFNLVGLLGFCFQFGALYVLKRFCGWHYLVATAAAVELAVLHNFLWHEHVTWADVAGWRRGAMGRFARFLLANGIISVGGNVGLTYVFVQALHVPYMLANAAAVLICSLINFVASDCVVFGAALNCDDQHR